MKREGKIRREMGKVQRFVGKRQKRQLPSGFHIENVNGREVLGTDVLVEDKRQGSFKHFVVFGGPRFGNRVGNYITISKSAEDEAVNQLQFEFGGERKFKTIERSKGGISTADSMSVMIFKIKVLVKINSKVLLAVGSFNCGVVDVNVRNS